MKISNDNELINMTPEVQDHVQWRNDHDSVEMCRQRFKMSKTRRRLMLINHQNSSVIKNCTKSLETPVRRILSSPFASMLLDGATVSRNHRPAKMPLQAGSDGGRGVELINVSPQASTNSSSGADLENGLTPPSARLLLRSSTPTEQ